MLKAFVERAIKRLFEIQGVAPQLCWVGAEAPDETENALNVLENAILRVNRNARAPKQANHGARPCSSVMRRLRKQGIWRKWKENMTLDTEEMNPKHLHDYKPGEMEEGTESKPGAPDKKEEATKKKESEGEKDQG